MKTINIDVKTTVKSTGEVRKASGICQVYDNLTEARNSLTEEHFEMLNSIIVIRAQDKLRLTLKEQDEDKLTLKAIKEMMKNDPEMKAKLQAIALSKKEGDEFIIEK